MKKQPSLNLKKYLKHIKFLQIQIKKYFNKKSYDTYGDSKSFDGFDFNFQNPFDFFNSNIKNGFFNDEELKLFGLFGESNAKSIFNDDFFKKGFGSGQSKSVSTSKSTKIVNGVKVTITKKTIQNGKDEPIVEIIEETTLPDGTIKVKEIKKGQETNNYLKS